MSGAGEEDREDGFLGRWSRRKREAQSRDLPSPPCGGELERGMPPSTDVAPGTEGAAGAIPPPNPPPQGEGSRAPVEPEIEPPSLDLIDKDFDLAHWLKQNVPESWKLAALRRAWESDPAIRDFENPARDYALDWNTPGGAPGYGPLSESDNVEEMLANIFGKPPEPPESPAQIAAAQAQEVRDDAAALQPSSNAADGETADASQQECSGPAQEPEAVRLSSDETPTKKPQKPAQITGPERGPLAAVQNSPMESPLAHRPRRRGGGATPL